MEARRIEGNQNNLWFLFAEATLGMSVGTERKTTLRRFCSRLLCFGSHLGKPKEKTTALTGFPPLLTPPLAGFTPPFAVHPTAFP